MKLITRGKPFGHSENTTYNEEYIRGLTGVNISLDRLITQILCASLGGVCVVILFGRLAQIGHSYLRRVISTVATPRQQTFWGVEESHLWASLKKHLLYAPLGRKRHNRELRLSEAVNVGTLPSRFHSLLIMVYVLSQVAYCTILDYDANEKAALVAELRGRSGNLAVLNMIPLFILAGRNNPLIPLLHVSFDTYNLFHRWIGRMVILESITHTVAWTINAVDLKGWGLTWVDLRTDPFFTSGLVGTLLMCFLLLQSPSPIRHAFYETFLHTHQLAALVIVVVLSMHLNIDQLPQVPWVIFIISFWVCERLARFARIVYLNLSRRHGMTKVVVEALPGEASRVTFHLPKRVRVPSGSHVYAYLPRISLWMSHPFSVAWVDDGISYIPRLPSSEKAPDSPRLDKTEFEFLESGGTRYRPTRVSLIVAARTGMTRKLYNAALASPNSSIEMTGFIEGPYTSHPSSFGSYGTVVLFSGGAGITHHMMHVRDLLGSAAAGTVATRKVYLIWSVRSTEHLAWVRGFMDQILRLPNRREILVTKLFISKPRSGREISSPSQTLQMFPGRCRPDVVLEEVLSARVGATAVSVCGPGAFADEVRAAVRNRLGKGIVIDFVEEAFTW
ncbi:hypothetical protein VTO42DRAFT_2757 [Malbranchea cinnamomea]